MLTLHQFPGHGDIANLSPFCMKVDCVLRMIGVDYAVASVRDLDSAPRRQVPFIDDGHERIGDSRLIVDHLQRRYAVDLDGHLSVGQRAAAHGLRVTLEQHLYFALVYARWVEEKNWAVLRDLYFADLSEPTRTRVADDMRASVVQKLYQQGLGRHARDQVYQLAFADITAAADCLGASPFVFGKTAGLTDAVLYAFVANLAVPIFEHPLRDHVLGHANLLAHADRMRARYFPSTVAIAA